MGKSKIQWCDYSFNPIRAKNKATGKVGWHCTTVTEGCKNCYSSTFNVRLGTGLEFKPGNEKLVHIFLDENMLRDPIRWHKRGGKRIFVASMTDLFGDFVETKWLDTIFSVFEQCPDHTFQVLTKRPRRMREYINNRYTRPLRNLWAGVSIAEQADIDRFVPDLRRTNAHRWLSIEPLIAPVDLRGCYDAIEWVVVGGESGPGARSMPIESVQKILGLCRAARIPFFFKQLSQADSRDYDKFETFPDVLQVREFPT